MVVPEATSPQAGVVGRDLGTAAAGTGQQEGQGRESACDAEAGRKHMEGEAVPVWRVELDHNTGMLKRCGKWKRVGRMYDVRWQLCLVHALFQVVVHAHHACHVLPAPPLLACRLALLCSTWHVSHTWATAQMGGWQAGDAGCTCASLLSPRPNRQ